MMKDMSKTTPKGKFILHEAGPDSKLESTATSQR